MAPVKPLSTPLSVFLLLSVSCVLGEAHYLIRENFFPEHSFHPKEPAPPPTQGVFSFGDTIHSTELSPLLQKKSNLLIVDVRADFFFEQEHIPGAVNWDRGEFSTWEPRERERIKKAERVILYCWDRSCESSKSVAELLRSSGHKNITVLSGGLFSWKQSNLPVEEGTGGSN